MKKKVLAALLTAAMVLTLAGCGSGSSTGTSSTDEGASEEEASAETSEEDKSEEADDSSASSGDEKDITIALLPKTLSNPYFVAMQDYAEKEAEELSKDGVKVTIEASAPPTEDDINQQLSMFEDYLEKGVDGIIICPCGTAEVVDYIKEANEKDVPVITIDTDADEGAEVAAFIGTNNYDGGKLAGEWTAENIDGEVAIITGMLGNQCHTDRTNGFEDGIEGADNVELVGDVQPCNGDQGTAMSIAENLLSTYPNLQCIYVTNDTGALGAAAAVEAAGRDVKVIGFDGSPDGAQSILDGGMTITIAQTPGIMAQEAVKAMVELLEDGTQPESQYTACEVVDESNAEDYLEWH